VRCSRYERYVLVVDLNPERAMHSLTTFGVIGLIRHSSSIRYSSGNDSTTTMCASTEVSRKEIITHKNEKTPL